MMENAREIIWEAAVVSARFVREACPVPVIDGAITCPRDLGRGQSLRAVVCINTALLARERVRLVISPRQMRLVEKYCMQHLANTCGMRITMTISGTDHLTIHPYTMYTVILT